MPKSLKYIFLTLPLSLNTSSAAEFPQPLPGELLHGYTLTENASYSPQNLYQYIDGGCEVYLAHNFQKLYTQRYEKPASPAIIADIFDMGSPQDAYGLYHHDRREASSAGIGFDSEINENAIFFWKGKYFISLIAFNPIAETMFAVTQLAESIAENISAAYNPFWFQIILPRKECIKGAPKFFHHPHCLNEAYFLADDNLFDLNPSVDCVFAEYQTKSENDCPYTYKTLLIRYPDEKSACDAFKHFNQVMRPDVVFSEAFTGYQEANQLWSAVRLYQNCLICVFDHPSREGIDQIVTEYTININNLTR